MSVYHDFLDFFNQHNRDRLDGIDASYFASMPDHERRLAISFLLSKLDAGGSDEIVNALFKADANAAVGPVRDKLKGDQLRPSAQPAAIWNLYETTGDLALIRKLIVLLRSPDARIRALAANYAPSVRDRDLICRLREMVRTETESEVLLPVVQTLMQCCGFDARTMGKGPYLSLYNKLCNDSSESREDGLQILGDLEV